MPETRQFTCIVCPRGCGLEVELDDGPTVLRVGGYGCKRGEDYARREVVDPRRSLTSTVRTRGLERRRLPVRSAGTLPLGRLVEAARALDGIIVDRPVKCGDLVVKDLLGLGVDIVATDAIGAAGSAGADRRGAAERN